MTNDDLLEKIDPKWHEAFHRFVETAEADAGFLDYMKQHPECERAVEAAIRREAESLGELSTLLTRSLARSPEMLSHTMADALRGTLELSKPAQIEVLTLAVDEVAKAGGAKVRARVKELLAAAAESRTGR